jgi:hypothetical protein
MNYEEAIKAMLRKYTFESTSRFSLSDEERISHMAAEAQYMVAQKYGFRSVAEMDEVMGQKAGKWQVMLDERRERKHGGIE